MADEKYVDESWKQKAEKEKDSIEETQADDTQESKIHVSDFAQKKEESEAAEQDSGGEATDQDQKPSADAQGEEPSGPPFEIDFLNYITSLGFQAMIFLGEMPNPTTNQTEKNLDQAKFIIDTLTMIKEKTEGNLNEQEQNILNSSIYELQMKYVDVTQKEDSQ